MADGVEMPVEEVFSFEGNVGEKRNLTPDAGLSKTILVEGTGTEKPQKGDDVTVHYIGTLESDDSEFDSSRGRGEPFNFKLGQGSVIKGWDVGVATMKKGEKAILTCSAEYAYGSRGSPPKIPGGATLNFEVELLSWKSDNDVSGDGGVMKYVESEGAGWETPNDIDELTVNYSVKVQGSDAVVAESPEGGEVFSLRGGGSFKALAVAAKAMKKGEKTRLMVSPEYGFGAEGSAARGIPGSATLEVLLELTGWKSVEDVTGDGGVIKKMLITSSEWKRPNAGASVKLRYEAHLMDGTLFDERKEGNELEAIIEEDQLPDGLERAVMKMKPGEKAEVAIQPQYAFGDSASKQPLAVVPPCATVVYTVELVEMIKAKETYDLSSEEKLVEAAARKDNGNAKFKAGKNELAVKKYKAALDMVKSEESMSTEQKLQAHAIKRSCNLNLAAAYLKCKKYKDAMDAASQVLEKDPSSVKALYRRAQAHLALANLVECDGDLRRALLYEPGNKDVRALFKQYKAQEAVVNKKDAALYSKMFKPSSETAPIAANGDAGAEQEAQPMETEKGDS